MYEQRNLFSTLEASPRPSTGAWQETVILAQDGEVVLYEHFFTPQESDRLFQDLYTGIQWHQEHLQLFGKQIPAPRLTAWHGDGGKVYTYSRLAHHPQPWTAPLTLIKERIETVAQVKFNGVLLNLYRTGNDSMAWHSDDEPELGPNPVIGSVSLGGTRRFRFRHRHQKASPVGVNLTHGSLLIMRGCTQHCWQHQLAKTTRPVRPRINLTFRVIR